MQIKHKTYKIPQIYKIPRTLIFIISAGLLPIIMPRQNIKSFNHSFELCHVIQYINFALNFIALFISCEYSRETCKNSARAVTVYMALLSYLVMFVTSKKYSNHQGIVILFAIYLS